MTRNLKLLGLALAATLVLGSTSASSASAYQPTFTLTGEFTSAKLVGTMIASPKFHQFTFGENVVECTKAKIEGKMPEKAMVEISLAQIYESCTAKVNGIGENLPATVTTNGCTYGYLAFPGAPGEDEYAAKLHIECPAGKAIEVHVFKNATEHNNNKPSCTYRIVSQTLEENAKIINDTTPKDVTLNTSSPFVAEGKGPNGNCTAKEVKSIYHSTTTVVAKSTALEEPIGLHIG
jgi:hypothetical protein